MTGALYFALFCYYMLRNCIPSYNSLQHLAPFWWLTFGHTL